jgi:hypothetical protein
LPDDACNGSHVSPVIENVSVVAEYRFPIEGKNKVRIKYERAISIKK